MDWRKRTSVCGFSAVALISTLLVLLSAASPTASAGPGDLFVTVTGSGTACTQVSPCDLWTAVAQPVKFNSIYLAAGTYTYTGTEVVSITKNADLLGGWTGNTTWPPIRSPSTFISTLDGQSARRVVQVGSGRTVRLDGLTVTNGQVSDKGAGVYASNAYLILDNVIVYSNTVHATSTDPYGGGVYVEGGTLAVDSSTFQHNYVVRQDGGFPRGGGLYAGGEVTVTISSSLFDANDAHAGSGIYLDGDGSQSHLMLSHTEFTDNGWGYSPGFVDGTYGGGMWLEDADVLVEDCSFLGNYVDEWGAALGCWEDVELTMSRNTIAGNTGRRWPGGWMGSQCPATLTNNIIVDNQSSQSGFGGLQLTSGGRLTHNTISGNDGTFGGCGVFLGNAEEYHLVNNIVVSHTLGISVYEYATVVMTNTLWGAGGWANGDDWGGSGSVTHSGDLWGNPSFVDPDGGDYHIWGDSAAFDQGVDAGVTDDVNGEVRPWTGSQAKAPDIGADEFWLIPTEDVNLPLVLSKH